MLVEIKDRRFSPVSITISTEQEWVTLLHCLSIDRKQFNEFEGYKKRGADYEISEGMYHHLVKVYEAG